MLATNDFSGPRRSVVITDMCDVRCVTHIQCNDIASFDWPQEGNSALPNGGRGGKRGSIENGIEFKTIVRPASQPPDSAFPSPISRLSSTLIRTVLSLLLCHNLHLFLPEHNPPHGAIVCVGGLVGCRREGEWLRCGVGGGEAGVMCKVPWPCQNYLRRITSSILSVRNAKLYRQFCPRFFDKKCEPNETRNYWG